MLIAGIVITDEEGGIVRQTTNAYGGYELCLEPGTYTLTFSKGAEYATEEKTVEVESLKTKYLPDVRLTQLYDSYAKGWIAGDCHQHTYYSDGVDSVQSLMISNASVGLYWGFLTDHNTSRGVPEWTSPISVNVASDEKGALRPFVGFDGVEVTTEFGHFNSLGSGLTLETYDMNLREAERASADKANFIREKMLYIIDSIKRVGGIAQMNHPYSSTTMGAVNWIEPDDYELLDSFETIEVWNGYFVPPDGIYTEGNSMNQNYQSKLMWFELLNAMKDGHAFHAATGGAALLLGNYYRFAWTALPNYGFDGFVVAIIAGNNPFYLPFAALFLGYLRSGTLQMSRVGVLPNELIYVIQAIIIIIFGAKTFISMVKKRRGGSDT